MVFVKAIVLALLRAHIDKVNGHFALNYPPSSEFSDDEGTAPCGGFDPSTKTDVPFYIGGDAIALQSTHPSCTWLFRATLDESAEGGWIDILPTIGQKGLGDFCEPGIILPP